ncbi:recombinase family protein [Streptomyces albiaxialis]|uniref:recombinase family protein n=1 Tax=Streptomyces albiaxialis TaxID=329523 RepID=UPI0031CDCD09
MTDELDEAARADLVERKECKRCRAPAGSPCRTHMGTVATRYHTGRYEGVPGLRSGPPIRIPADRNPGTAWAAGPELPDQAPARPGDRIGYARVSGRSQDVEGQVTALTEAGCVEIYPETISTRHKEREEYPKALAALRANDILTVTRLDRLGRDMIELIVSAQDLEQRGNRLEILSGPLAGMYDPQGPGKILFVMFAAFAEIERDFIRDRTMDGLDTAAAKGKRGGRPRAVDADRLAIALARRAEGESVPSIAERIGIGRSTLYRAMDDHDRAASLAAATDLTTSRSASQ